MTANTKILLKRSDVPGHIPPAANLEYGELALNYADGALFGKLTDNTVINFALPPAQQELYVALEGKDTNDGKTIGRPFRTIRAALNAAAPNTCIKLGPGTFVEETPLVMPQQVTLYGSGTRGTAIIPANTQSDIIYVTTGCYLTGFGFKNYIAPSVAVSYPGTITSGICPSAPPTANKFIFDPSTAITSGDGLEDYYREMTIQIIGGTGVGQEAVVISYNVATHTATLSSNWTTLPDNTTQYRLYIPVSFTPQPFTKRYSTFITHSPYLYNLTSVTTTGTGMVVDGYKSAGLKSFVVAQFTQFNQGGNGFIVKNLGYAQLVSIYAICCDEAFRADNGGTASMGNCNINFGNKGIIANGVSPIMLTGKLTPPFKYNKVICQRDVGLIIDAVAQDLLFNGTSQTTFAGIQYFNQGSYVGAIQSELLPTANAISYVSDLCSYVVVNNTSSGTRYITANTQNTSLAAATSVEADTVKTDFSYITSILLNGSANATDKIKPNGITANSNTNVQHAYALIQANKPYIQDQGIAYVEANKPLNFTYDTVKCRRDIGYMVDSVCFDLLYGGNRQAIQSGVYYYSYNASSSVVSTEIPQVTAAYNYMKNVAGYVITANKLPFPAPWQTDVDQVVSSSVGTANEVNTAGSLIDNITNIINNGPSVAAAPAPIGLIRSTNPSVQNAATLLHNNRAFFAAEISAYIDAVFATQDNYQISIDSIVANTDPQTALTANTKPYVGLVLNIDGDTDITGNVYRTVLASKTDPITGKTSVQFQEFLANVYSANTTVRFYARSSLSASGQTFEYVGAGTDVATALPRFGYGNIIKANQVISGNGGVVYFTGTDQFGNFQIGSDLVINFNTGTLSGRTFTRSLFAQITPFILALEN
jgi:hypothetical protein